MTQDKSEQEEPNSLSDDVIKRRLEENRHKNFDLVVIKYREALVIVARGYVNDDAEDVVQESMLSAYHSLSNERLWTSEKIQQMNIWGWLYVIVKHRCSYFHRRTVTRHQEQLPPDNDIEAQNLHNLFAKPDGMPVEELERSEVQKAISAAIERLPLSYREIMRLRYIEGMDYATIGSILDENVNTVRNKHFRHLPVLQAILLEELRNRGEYELASQLEEHLKRINEGEEEK